MDKSQSLLITSGVAANMLGVTVQTVHNLIRTGRLRRAPGRNKRLMFRLEEVTALEATRRTAPRNGRPLTSRERLEAMVQEVTA
jgi:hypothetical protein